MAKTCFFWDELEDNIVEEFDDAGVTLADYTTEPAHFGNVISQRRGGQSSFFHHDALGSTLAVTDESQAVTDTRAYSAFGEIAERSGGTDFPFQYIGRQGYYWVSMLAVHSVRRRIYTPVISRWHSYDPLGIRTEEVGLYSYVHNAPLASSDPSGLELHDVPPIFVETIESHLRDCKCESAVDGVLKNPAFRDLLQCAIKSGCLRKDASVICRPCKENAAYVHGSWYGSHIQVCTGNWSILTPQDQSLVLYEELYHSITVCGNLRRRDYSPSLRELVRIYHRSVARGIYPAGGNFGCFLCYGKEYIAKACARRSVGLGIPTWGSIHGEVSASCEPPCNSGHFLPGSLEGELVATWYNAHVISECFELDSNCIITGHR